MTRDEYNEWIKKNEEENEEENEDFFPDMTIDIDEIKTILTMKEKLKNFLNSLTWEEAMELYRFLRTRTWAQWIDDAVHHRKIE